jgi:hypothetical protein
MISVDADESMKNLASLKQSLQDSEAFLRQMKQTIQVVDARLKPAESKSETAEGANHSLSVAI